MICYPLLGKNGEFGNQLFQVAATVSHAHDCSVKAVFPKWGYNFLFKNKIDETFNENLIQNKYTEKHFYYDEIPKLSNLALYGYFQSEKYFKHNRRLIENQFEFADSHMDYVNKRYGSLLQEDTVGVHLRTYSRGAIDPRHIYPDVLDNISYLKQAFSYFGSSRTFIICSDNIDKAESMLGSNKNLIFIRGENLYTDFHILTRCRNHINSASSFSWWAAWLNKSKDKKIIVPAKWFLITPEIDPWFDSRDVVPETWISLE